MEQSGSKRKRALNTSNDQYELYLEALEGDYILRSGTIDPTVEDGYIEKKWQELASRLNAVGQGPALSKEIWKKRFKDWKNATRSKYRRIKESQTATGGGTGTKIFLTPLEERGLEVWGRVTVTGNPQVQVVGGLGHLNKKTANLSQLEDEVSEVQGAVSNGTENGDLLLISPVPTTDASKNPEFRSSCSQANNKTPRKGLLQKNKRNIKTPKTLNKVGEELQEAYQETNNIFKSMSENLIQFSRMYEEVNTVRNNIEKQKLAFEIAKFKFENPSFQFDYDKEEN